MARRRKKTTEKKPARVPEIKSKRISTPLILSILITLVLGGIPFGIGKYIEFNSPGPFDSGAFVYSAKHILDGARYGIEEMSSARPNTMLANMLGVKLFGFNETGPKFIQMIFQLSAFIFMFYTLYRVFGPVAAVFGTSVAAIYLSAPLIAKFGNVKEQFMIPVMIAAACCYLLNAVTEKKYWLVLSGFFAVQGYYFKPIGLSVVVALVVCLIAVNLLSRKWKTLGVDLGLFIAGYVIGLLVPGILYIMRGTPLTIVRTLPAVILQAGLLFGLLIVCIIFFIIYIRKVHLFKKLCGVSRWILITGACLIFIALAVSVTIIKKEPGFQGGDISSYIHDIPLISIPTHIYYTLEDQVNTVLVASGIRQGYVSDSWKAVDFSVLGPRVFRYYKALSVPILGALISIITAAAVWLHGWIKKTPPQDIHSKIVWMLAIWWILDMAFVWGSPRSYEQYYLPLCGSAAMLSGYGIWKWQKRWMLSQYKVPWLACALATAILFIALSIPIFIGQRYSPDQGKKLDYIERYGYRRRGFGPALKEMPSRQQGAWIAVGDFIRSRSTENDKIYVWGWYPGIYVQAQRMAPVPKAFDGNMHVTPPHILNKQIGGMVYLMKKDPPKFIVDSRKRHYPNDRPPLELWPIVPPKFFGNEKARPLSNNPQEIATFDAKWKKVLETQIEPAEAERYEVMKTLRDFVMNNYRIAGQYGAHIIFERK